LRLLVAGLITLIILTAGCIQEAPARGVQNSRGELEIHGVTLNSPHPGEPLKIIVNGKADRLVIELKTPSGVMNLSTKKSENIFIAEVNTTEGVYEVMRVYAYLNGKKLVRTIEKKIKVFDLPKITLWNVSRLNESGEIIVEVKISDSSEIKRAILTYEDKSVELETGGSIFIGTLRIKSPEEAGKISFTVTAVDSFNNTATQNFVIDWPLRDAYSYFVVKNGFNPQLAIRLFDNNKLFQYIYSWDRNLTFIILNIADCNGERIEDNIVYKVLKLVKDYQSANLYFNILYRTQTCRAKEEVLNALNYYVDAVLKQNLPEHDYDVLKLFINASNKDPELVDFEPIIVKDNYGHRVIIDSYNKPRDTWMIVEFIKRNPYVASDDNLYLPVNMLIKEMAWNFFDNKFGPRYADKHHNNLSDEELDKIYQPTNEDIWYIIQKLWDYYYTGIGKRYQYVKWWDKQEFAKQYPTELERKLILIGLWDLPNQVADFSHTHPDIRGGWDYDVVWGLKAQKLFVDQLEQMYDILEQTRTTSKGK